MEEKNQLLIKDVESLNIDFNNLKPEDFEDALSKTLEKAVVEFDRINSIKNHKFDELFSYPEASRLMAIYNLLSTLNSLVKNIDYRNIFEKYNEILTVQFIKWNFDKKNYSNLELYAVSDDFQMQSIIRQNIVLKTIKELKKSGINLSSLDKKKFLSISKKIESLTLKFINNNTDSQEELYFIVNKSSLKGLNSRALANIESLRLEKGLSQDMCYINEISGLLSDAMLDVRKQGIRKKIYEARKKSCLSGKYNNTKIIDQIYKLKQQRAAILGYKSVAHEVLEHNMVKSPEAVQKFINDLGNATLPYARQQFEELKNFGENLLKRPMKPWDFSFVAKKMEKKNAKLDLDVIRNYFPVKHVVDSLFDFCEEKFSVTFREINKKTWNEDVRVYEVYENSVLVGTLYMDLYKREGKRPGAWLSAICSSRDNSIDSKKAVALLVCNTPKDINESTFSLDDVVTLFHEMGHALHHLLSKVKEQYYSGFNNVEQDAVEFPSQLLDMFVYNKNVLKRISKNVITGENLSNKLIKKIQDSKKFLGAIQIMRSLQYSDMDMSLYLQNEKHPFEIEKEITEKWIVNPDHDSENYIMKKFIHIFAGYSAGYYGYQWAEVLSADAFNFLTEKVSKKESQKRFYDYKKHILYTGGETPMSINYHNFTKSEPNVKSLIKQYL